MVAPQKAVEAVAAAALPSDEAFQRERDLFFECLTGPQSAALIHAFSTERAVWKIPEADHSPRAIDRVGVVGGGTMGSGIATAALLAGFPLVLAEQNSEAGARAKSVIASNLDGAVKRGKISDAKRQALLDENLTVETDLEALASQDLIIEAVFEDMAVKSDIFGRLDRAAKPGAILASNTSCLDLNEIARGTSRPQSVIGLHFFSPAHVMRLLEVVVGAETAPEVTAAGFALARKLRKVAVRAGVCEGFIGNRILHHYLDAADHLVLAGAEPEAVDNAMQEFGFALGPFAVNDLAGIDISIATRTREGVGSKPTLEQRMAEAGWLGRKSGKGYYVYEGKDRTANPELPELIAATRASAGLTPRAFDSEEIVDRIMTAMVAEASRVLEEGIALRPIDIDAVYLFGYGFPRFLGGPMHYADAVGAKMVLERIERFAELDGDFWRAPAILRRMAKDGSRFADMNR
ncbi:MAG: 3-hydroxyacyl-CoA dehydrogenase NAD-binding domain-containing protein [Pseudomonadota bacterium]